MINNPENLSKDRLKEELRRRGITFSPGKGKDYYVSIYRQHFSKRSMTTRQRSEFSSDDEAFKKMPKTPPRDRKYTKVLNVEHYRRQLAPISESELRYQLKKHNIDVGPITGSTRSVYEKKLAKIMADKAKSGGVSTSSSGVTIASGSDEEEDISSDDDGEEEETDNPPTQQQSVKPQVSQVVRQRIDYSKQVLSSSSSPYRHNLRSRPTPYEPRSPSYEPRSALYERRPAPYEPRPQSSAKPVSIPKPLPSKPTRPKYVEEETDETSTIDVDTKGSFARPYRAAWCTVWNMVQVLLLLVSFVVGLIVFDYIRNGESRLVTWVQNMINGIFEQEQ